MAYEESEQTSPGWRFQCGIGLLALIIVSWVLVPIASAVGATGAQIATLVGVLFVSNKILLIAAIAVMGKAGFAQLKATLRGHLKSLMAWPDEIGVVRHRIGLVCFCLPLLAAFLDHQVDVLAPQLAPYKVAIRVVGDLMLVASFFLLGANFWDKLRALFIREAKVVAG